MKGCDNKYNHTLQASNTSRSVSNDKTSTPAIGEQVLRVMTFRTKG